LQAQEERTLGSKQKTRSSQTGLFKIEKVPAKETTENGYRMPDDVDVETMETGNFGAKQTVEWVDHNNSEGQD
jgi:hypothetical protein